MARPVQERILEASISPRGFDPAGQEGLRHEESILTLDEAEAIRLADLEGLYQQAAAQRMGVSRQTFGRIVESARRKVADAIINGKRLRIEGGKVALGRGEGLPLVVAATLAPDGLLEPRFGRTERFGVYVIGMEGAIESEDSLEACIGPGCKSGSASRLAAMGVRVLITGCIGAGALRLFAAHGIEVLRGAAGRASDLVLSYARGELSDDGGPCPGGCHEGGPVGCH